MKVAVIPAAGKGTRFFELGNNYAKTLLPYDGVPILERIINRLVDKVDEIRVVVNTDCSKIHSFLEDLSQPKVSTVVVPADGPQGPGRSFMAAITGKESYIFLHLSDTLFEFDFENLCGDWVSVMNVSHPERWCMIKSSGEILDKPKDCSPEFKAITGAYSFSDPKALKEACDLAILHTGDNEFQLSHIFKYYNNYNPN